MSFMCLLCVRLFDNFGESVQLRPAHGRATPPSYSQRTPSSQIDKYTSGYDALRPSRMSMADQFSKDQNQANMAREGSSPMSSVQLTVSPSNSSGGSRTLSAEIDGTGTRSHRTSSRRHSRFQDGSPHMHPRRLSFDPLMVTASPCPAAFDSLFP